MSRDRFARIDAIFTAAGAVEGVQREQVLRELCGDDTTLRREVEALLAHDERPHELLRAPIVPPIGGGDADAPLPESIGDYRIIDVLGSGGMGVVYRAKQSNPRRIVALKVVNPLALGPGALRRFDQEAQVLGLLSHTGIARIFEAGTADVGGHRQPFFAMELVNGRPITEHSAELPVNARLELFARACDAVQHAHDNGVIHRDLKPRNILVGDDGQPKILDFGVARATRADLQVTTLLTQTGQLVGTLPYMSPEQVGGRPSAVDHRADVYALGVIAYELLTGRCPFDATGRSLPEMARVVCSEDAAPLSSFDRTYRGDLDTIIAKALEKEPDLRYQSAAELAADVRRYLADEPIVAVPMGTMYQLRKFARRNKTLVGGVLAVLITLLAGVVVATTFAINADRQRELTEEQRAAASWNAYVANLAAAEAAIDRAGVADARQYLESCPAEHRGWEWAHLHGRLDRSLLVYRGHHRERNVKDVLFLPADSGMPMASCSDDGSVHVWDGLTGTTLHRFARQDHDGHDGHGAWVHGVSLAPDGTRIVSCSQDQSMRIWDPVDGRLVEAVADLPGAVRAVHWLTETTILGGTYDGKLLSWRPGSNSTDVVEGHGRCIESLAAAGDSLVSSGFNEMTLWSAPALQVVARTNVEGIYDGHVNVSPDGRTIANGRTDGIIEMRSIDDLSIVASWTAHAATVMDVAFAPDGSTLASASADRTIRLWDASSQEPRGVLLGHEEEVRRVRFSPDGRWLATASNDGTARLWDPLVHDVRVLRGHIAAIYALDVSPDGRHLVSGGSRALGDDGAVIIWDASTGALLHEHQTDPVQSVTATAFDPTGERVAFVMEDDWRIWMWEPKRGAPEPVVEMDASPAQLAFLDQRRVLIGFNFGGGWAVHDLETGRQLLRLDGHGANHAIAVDPSGRWFAVPGPPSTVRLFDARTLQQGDFHDGFSGSQEIDALAFDHTGNRIAIARRGLGVFVADTATRAHLWMAGEPTGHVRSLAFTPDGTRLISGGSDHTVRFRDAADGRGIVALHGHDDTVYRVLVAPDGSYIATCSRDRTVRVWDG